MTSNIIIQPWNKPKVKLWPNKLLLFVTFIWASTYPAVGSILTNFVFGYGNVFDSNSENLSVMITYILSDALFSWIGFELLFYFYRYILAFKVYSFIVPMEQLKNETRLFYSYKNIFYGIFVNLCFLYPFIYEFIGLINLVVTMTALLIYANHLNKTYSEPLIGHFVFKCFCYPVFVYEALYVLVKILGVLA